MNLLKFLISITPVVVDAVIAIQRTVAAPGLTKKQMIVNSISIAASHGEVIPEDHVKAVSKLIDATVASLKNAGTLPKALPAPQFINVPIVENESAVGTPGQEG